MLIRSLREHVPNQFGNGISPFVGVKGRDNPKLSDFTVVEVEDREP